MADSLFTCECGKVRSASPHNVLECPCMHEHGSHIHSLEEWEDNLSILKCSSCHLKLGSNVLECTRCLNAHIERKIADTVESRLAGRISAFAKQLWHACQLSGDLELARELERRLKPFIKAEVLQPMMMRDPLTLPMSLFWPTLPRNLGFFNSIPNPASFTDCPACDGNTSVPHSGTRESCYASLNPKQAAEAGGLGIACEMCPEFGYDCPCHPCQPDPPTFVPPAEVKQVSQCCGADIFIEDRKWRVCCKCRSRRPL